MEASIIFPRYPRRISCIPQSISVVIIRSDPSRGNTAKMPPKTYQAYRRTSGPTPRTIELYTETLPQHLAPHEVLIKVKAVSLNWRDIAMLNGRYPADHDNAGIPCSDCVGEVSAIGDAVANFTVGDRVCPCFNLDDLDGKQRDGEVRTLGGSVTGQAAGPGVLSEYVVFEDQVLVRVPGYLSWEEVSILILLLLCSLKGRPCNLTRTGFHTTMRRRDSLDCLRSSKSHRIRYRGPAPRYACFTTPLALHANNDPQAPVA